MLSAIKDSVLDCYVRGNATPHLLVKSRKKTYQYDLLKVGQKRTAKLSSFVHQLGSAMALFDCCGFNQSTSQTFWHIFKAADNLLLSNITNDSYELILPSLLFVLAILLVLSISLKQLSKCSSSTITLSLSPCHLPIRNE